MGMVGGEHTHLSSPVRGRMRNPQGLATVGLADTPHPNCLAVTDFWCDRNEGGSVGALIGRERMLRGQCQADRGGVTKGSASLHRS